MSSIATFDEMSMRERSDFFRALLLIMAADGEVHESEQRLFRQAILPLGFSAEFVSECIETILGNKYVSHVPPRFENQANAYLLLRTALDVAFADGILDGREYAWLHATADLNAIPAAWLEEQICHRKQSLEMPANGNLNAVASMKGGLGNNGLV